MHHPQPDNNAPRASIATCKSIIEHRIGHLLGLVGGLEIPRDPVSHKLHIVSHCAELFLQMLLGALIHFMRPRASRSPRLRRWT